MENESLSAQIVTLKLINTKFKARIAELEAQLEEEKQRTFVQYERAVGFSALNATLEARLKESEADRLLDAELVKRIDADGFAVALRERAEKAEADAGRFKLALEQVGKWTKFYMPLADGSSWEETLREVASYTEAALSPAEQADDEKGVEG